MSDPAMSSKPVVSVITVFWNGRSDVARFFGALERASARLPFALELIAVDNASSDGTAELVAREYPHVRLLRNDANLGFAHACNQGLEAARGDYLLLLNPDCEADADALAAMARALHRNPGIGAVGCTLLHRDGLPQNSGHAEPSWLSYWASHSLLSPALLRISKAWARSLGVSARARSVDWLMGACLMVPREVFDDLGGLDPEYFMYSEDADWCRRIRDAGWEVVLLPRWKMVHHHGTSARRQPEFTFRRLYRSMLMYTRKHHGALAGLALRAAVLADMALRLPIYLIGGQWSRLDSVRRVAIMYLANDPRRFPDAAPGQKK